MRVVVLGGTGNFGARICRALQANPDIEVLSASRRGALLPNGAGVRSVQLDAGEASFPAALAALGPDLVIHCVGPFQGQDYRVVQAALRAKAHYLDLADGRAFVAGFQAANDAQARAADRLAISGASTVPALSSAVLDAIAPRIRTIDTIELVIAPGQRAPRGAATLRSVFSYLGRPFKWLHAGNWIQVHGWEELKRVRLDCGTRWAAACDVPDLELLPLRNTSARTVEFRAALEVGIQHFALWFLAALRRRGGQSQWTVGQWDSIASQRRSIASAASMEVCSLLPPGPHKMADGGVFAGSSRSPQPMDRKSLAWRPPSWLADWLAGNCSSAARMPAWGS